MILNRTIEIKASGTHVAQLRKFYPNIKKGILIRINISDLSRNSHIIIDVKCDICGIEKKLSFSKYNKNIDNGGYYSCSKKCAFDKNRKTYFNKTGFTHQMLNPDVKNSIKNTCLKKYGVDHPKKSKEVENKSKETCLKNNNVPYGFLLEKSKITLIEKYGVDNAMKCEFIKNKSQETNIIKYGNKTTLLNIDVMRKTKSTMIRKYGVEHPLQNEVIMNNIIKSSFKFKIHETGIIYQGKYEKHFLDFCKENNISVLRGPTFKYDINKIYFSDFFIKDKNLIIEVKSTYIWNKNVDKNIKKKESVINSGYNYLIVMDKNYNDLKNILKN